MCKFVQYIKHYFAPLIFRKSLSQFFQNPKAPTLALLSFHLFYVSMCVYFKTAKVLLFQILFLFLPFLFLFVFHCCKNAKSSYHFAVTSNGRSLSDWVVSLQNKILMPDPHSETGSQDIIIIGASESLVKLGPKLSGY